MSGRPLPAALGSKYGPRSVTTNASGNTAQNRSSALRSCSASASVSRPRTASPALVVLHLLGQLLQVGDDVAGVAPVPARELPVAPQDERLAAVGDALHAAPCGTFGLSCSRSLHDEVAQLLAAGRAASGFAVGQLAPHACDGRQRPGVRLVLRSGPPRPCARYFALSSASVANSVEVRVGRPSCRGGGTSTRRGSSRRDRPGARS